MPEESKVILKYMSQHNWLLSYKNLEGIRRALKGLSQRMKYYHPMDEAIREFEKDLSAYTKDFYEFFPLLKLHIQPFTKGAT